ncbi:MAG: AsnC family transcriptional regulator, partial [Sphingomonadaceae bacterium]|nr:AsnC family transcriptional regulator [Sphingomonadaceae bacterium]
MRLSNMADYAVVIMSAASRHCGFARVSATDLAAETGLALPTAQKLVS